MRTVEQIESLLDELDSCIADDLEDQDLDFKRWDEKSMNQSVKQVIRMAVCMANGGGGTVVFGVAEHEMGRENAILGVPWDVDINTLKLAVYGETDPKITPTFEEMTVPEGTGRLIVMQIYPGMPPYTDAKGLGKIRVGKDCKPLTGTLRKKLMVEGGENDYTAELVAKVDKKLLSPVALESLRKLAREANAPSELLALDDIELLSSIGLITNDQFSRAAILLAGTDKAIRGFLSGYDWTFLQMKSDVEYEMREDGNTAIAQAIGRIEDLIAPFNKITTVVDGLYHFEYKDWPSVSVREALLNAFGHNDLRIAGPVMVKLFSDKLEISNNGGLIGGITEENILHHKPAARNPLLINALTVLRLVNRSNLGISRMFSAFLIEGKRPPIIDEIGESVTVTLYKSKINPEFRFFAQDELEKGHALDVDKLLVMQRLLDKGKLNLEQAAKLVQRDRETTVDLLKRMVSLGYLLASGVTGDDTWSLTPGVTRSRQLTTDILSGDIRRIPPDSEDGSDVSPDTAGYRRISARSLSWVL
jgi:ATP-dependent DNA helicase RecG